MSRHHRADRAFLAAVVDTLLPGDDGVHPLSTGSAAGVADRIAARLASSRDAQAHLAVLGAIARGAGGEATFARSDATTRAETLRAVEMEMPSPFASLVALAITEYYDADLVILAMGWRAEPPQPLGHALAPFDERLLEAVRRRARLWRDPGHR